MTITPELVAAALERLQRPKIEVRLDADDRAWLEELGFDPLWVEPGFTELRHPDGIVVLDHEMYPGLGGEYETYVVTSTRGDVVVEIEQIRVGGPYDTARVRVLSQDALLREHPYALERLARARRQKDEP